MVEPIGTAVQAAGGGIIGAVAVMMVALGVGAAYLLFRAYQKNLEDNRKDDAQEKQCLRDEIKALREEGTAREVKLLELVANQQAVAKDTNSILQEIRNELSYLKGVIGK
jgi:uncharacterized protein HemX